MSAVIPSASTLVINAKHESVFGPHLHSLIKSLILNILRANDYSVEYDDFVYKVVRSRWDEMSEETKFGVDDPTETEAIMTEMQHERILRECTIDFDLEKIPRLVSIQYAQDYSNPPLSGNMYPPVGNFHLKGMVIDLGSREILNPGMPWIKTVEDIQTLDDICTDSCTGCNSQIPIEGATVSMFLDTFDDQIYLATGHRVLSLRKVYLHNRGSRWNFFGKDLQFSSGGIFSIGQTSRGFNIHAAALECIVNGCLAYKQFDTLPETEEEILPFIEDLLRSTIFGFDRKLVITGIVTGKSFAGQSRTMLAEDLEFTSFTPTTYLLRRFDQESGKTIWTQDFEGGVWECIGGELDSVFHPYSIDTRRFVIKDLPSAYYSKPSAEQSRWLTSSNGDQIHLLDNKEDLLFFQDIQENGSRQVFRYCASQTEFRVDVLRGIGQELVEIGQFFPKHRARTNPTPANIHERVHQIITLSIAGKSTYSFQQIDLLGSLGAREFRDKISAEVGKLSGKDLFDHWKDVAFPLSEFSIQASEVGSTTVPRMLVSETNRKLCNGLTVLYACASEPLRPQIVRSVAEYFYTRALVAATAFLPHHAYTKIEARYFGKFPQTDNNERVPIGIHKLRMLRNLSQPSPTNSSRKYKIAGLISKNTLLDVMTMGSTICV